MRIYESHGSGTGDQFPFRSLRLVGWTLLILSIIVLILGVVDVGWTAGNFVGVNCQATGWPTAFLHRPCDHEVLVWTWVAVAVWAPLFIIITGIIGTRFSEWRSENLKFHRDLFSLLCVSVALLWAPVIIVILALEIFYGRGVFYYMDATNKLQLQDPAKFVVPLLAILVTFFIWIAAMMGVALGCCCAPVYNDDYDRGDRGRVRRVVRRDRGGGGYRDYDAYDNDAVVPRRRADYDDDYHYDSYPRRSRSTRSFRSAPNIPSNLPRGQMTPIGPPQFLPISAVGGGTNYPGSSYTGFPGMGGGAGAGAFPTLPTYGSAYPGATTSPYSFGGFGGLGGYGGGHHGGGHYGGYGGYGGLGAGRALTAAPAAPASYY